MPHLKEKAAMNRSKVSLCLIFSILLLFPSEKSVAGEYVYYDGTASMLRSLTISGESIPGNVLYPGTPANPSAADNVVIVDYSSGPTPLYFVYGGAAETGIVSGNKVWVINGDVAGFANFNGMGIVYGGHLRRNGILDNNQVIWDSAGFVNSLYGGHTSEATNTDNNLVIINNGIIGVDQNGNPLLYATVTGGWAAHGNVYGNKVVINGGMFRATVAGGYAVTGRANNNEVIITGGTISPSLDDPSNLAVIGGHTSSSGVEASHNKVTISGGTINGYVYGGYSVHRTTNNTIIITNGPNLTNAYIHGSDSTALSVWSQEGNKLILNGFHGKVRSIAAFQYYDFYLPASLGVGDSLLTVTNNMTVDMRNTTVSIKMDGNSPAYNIGDHIYLVNVETGTGIEYTGMNSIAIADTGLVAYEWEISRLDAQKLQATLLGIKVTAQSRLLLQPPAGSFGFLSLAADLISAGLLRAQEVIEKTPFDWVSFAVLNGGSIRYKSGSHTDVSGGFLLAGLGRRISVGARDGFVGIFAETGTGSFRGENGAMTSRGNLRHYGGGFLARYDIDRLYIDAAIRMGSTHLEHRSNDTPGYTAVNYEASTPYYGLQAGIGYDVKINDRSSLELYGRYFWVHQKEKDVQTLSHRVHLAAADSHRIKAGMKYYRDIRTKITPYIGVGYEYEFDGKLRGTVNGMEIPHSSLKGGSAFGETGIQTLPLKAHRNLLLDLNLTGHTGQRTGVVGFLKMKYEF